MSVEAARVETGSSNVLKKGEFGYPNGHLGHLSAEQEKALEDFRNLVAQKGLYRPATAEVPASHDDITLLRYLRARRFVPKDALGQFQDTEKWRADNEIDNLYENIDVEAYEETRKLYPQWTGRRDKRGLPVYVFEVAPLNNKTMSAYAKNAAKTTVLHSKKDHKDVPPRLYRLFALYENLTSFIMPLCSHLRDRPTSATPISQANNIVDISNVGLKQFWNLRSHMQDASVLATAHYPETLDRIFIVGAPSFFPTVWSWIKRWFDPITTSKIFILSESIAFKTLSQFIEPENIPKKYGGTLPFEFGGRPILDGKIDNTLTWKDPANASWPQGPTKWARKGDGTWDLTAVGSVGGKERRQVLATFKPDALPTDDDKDLAGAVGNLHVASEQEQKPHEEESRVSNGAAITNADTAAPNAYANDPTVNAASHVQPVPFEATATSLPQPTSEEKDGLKFEPVEVK